MLRRLFFPDGDGTGGGSGNGDGGGAGSEGGGGGSGDGGKGAGGEGGGGGNAGAIQMTQAQLNDRIERARNSDRLATAKAAGFESIEAMQEAAKAGKQAQDAALTETQRAQATAATAAAERDTAREQLNGERITNAFFVEAMRANIPTDRLADVVRLLDRAGVTVKDDGSVTGMEDAVKALTESRPWLIAGAGNGGGNGARGNGVGGDGGAGNGGGNGGGGRSATLTAEQAAYADAFGVSRDRVAESVAARPGTKENADYVTTRAAQIAESLKPKR